MLYRPLVKTFGLANQKLWYFKIWKTMNNKEKNPFKNDRWLSIESCLVCLSHEVASGFWRFLIKTVQNFINGLQIFTKNPYFNPLPDEKI